MKSSSKTSFQIWFVLMIWAVDFIASVGGVSESTVNVTSNASYGKIAYVSAGNIYIINPDGTNETRLTSGISPIWSPDGTKIAFKRDFALYVLNADGTNEIKVADNVAEISWSPDSRKIAFAAYTASSPPSPSGGIFIINVDGSQLIKIINGSLSSPSFSPDGTKIAYFRYVSDPVRTSIRLCIMNSDGTGKIEDIYELHVDVMGTNVIDWSPDGDRIVVGGTSGEIVVMNANGTNQIRIATNNAAYPKWSPDGRKIAYFQWGAEYGIYVVNPDGTSRTKVIGKMTEDPISWSPDSKKIVFAEYVMGGEGAIYTINVDGSELTQLAYGKKPQWIISELSSTAIILFISFLLTITVLLTKRKQS